MSFESRKRAGDRGTQMRALLRAWRAPPCLMLIVSCSHNPAAVGSADAGVGQSGIQATHNFTASTDTVTDNVTHLVWQRGVPATYAGCTGTHSVPDDTCSWTEAAAYCSSPALATALGGTGWRLPTKMELESIVDASQRPTIDSVSFPDTPNDFFWSSSPYESEPGYAWVVFFSDGNSGSGDESYNYHVRCVR